MFTNELGINVIVVAFGPKQFFGPIVVHVAPLARLRGGMEAHAEEMTVPAGKLRQLSSGKWHVRCKWCGQEARFEADLTEDEAYGMLEKWRLSIPKRQEKYRFWACPICKEWYEDDKIEATTDTAESASQLAPTTATTTDTAESASQEVQQLKAEVVELKAEIERLKAEVVQLKFGLKAVADQHVASEAVHDDVTKKLKQMVEKLTAQVTAVPDDK